MIKTVFFDFGGTLGFEPLPHAESLHNFLTEHGIEATKEEVKAGEQAMRAFDEERLAQNGGNRSKSLAERYWFNVCLRFAREISSVPDSQDLAEFLHANYQIIPYELYDDTIPALETLRARGLSLGIISNYDAPTLEFSTRGLGLRPYFEMVLSSRCAESEKPETKIFEEACRRIGADPATSMHVGDSFEADVEGAKKVGITPVWVYRDGQTPARDCHVVKELTELPALVDQLNAS